MHVDIARYTQAARDNTRTVCTIARERRAAMRATHANDVWHWVKHCVEGTQNNTHNNVNDVHNTQ
jgi:hypothetical protein